MTDEMKVAFVLSQVAMFNAEIAQMQAENQHRIACGYSVAYADDGFQEVINRYSGTLGHNAVLEYFRS